MQTMLIGLCLLVQHWKNAREWKGSPLLGEGRNRNFSCSSNKQLNLLEAIRCWSPLRTRIQTPTSHPASAVGIIIFLSGNCSFTAIFYFPPNVGGLKSCSSCSSSQLLKPNKFNNNFSTTLKKRTHQPAIHRRGGGCGAMLMLSSRYSFCKSFFPFTYYCSPRLNRDSGWMRKATCSPWPG